MNSSAQVFPVEHCTGPDTASISLVSSSLHPGGNPSPGKHAPSCPHDLQKPHAACYIGPACYIALDPHVIHMVG